MSLRINQRLRENRDAGAPQLIVEDLWELLQYHVTTYFDNQTSGIPPARHRSGRPLKTLVQRLKGKEGRFRSNLSGKRVNFSARTGDFARPEPYRSMRSASPMRLQGSLLFRYMSLSPICRFPEDHSKKREQPTTGRQEVYPGVNYVIRPDGRRMKVTDRNAESIADGLEIGICR